MVALVVSGTSANAPSAMKSTSRIHVRVEHVQPSRCSEASKVRKVKNDQLEADAKAKGEVIRTERQREGPKPCFMGFMVEVATLETVTPIPYVVVQ